MLTLNDKLKNTLFHQLSIKIRKKHNVEMKNGPAAVLFWTLLINKSVVSDIHNIRGGSRIYGKWVHIYKGVGVRFADFISFSLNIP